MVEPRTVFVTTIVGVGIDTVVSVHSTHAEAQMAIDKLIDEYEVEDMGEICTDVVKGYSVRAQCDVEMQVHATEYYP